ncbi:MAG TPA: hypothetical protein VGF84_17980 [Micromonosporaceae bacterium]
MSPNPSPSITPSPSPSASTAPAPAGLVIKIGDVDGKKVLVDGDGRTLYAFAKDKTTGDGTCNADCVKTWPVVPAPATAGEGVSADHLGTHKRADGTEQVTYYGDPLYYNVQDTKAGEANGVGVNGQWYLETATGRWTT